MSDAHGLVVSGILPHLTVSAEAAPPRSECGIGALMPWAGRLWYITYVSHTSSSGAGTGLYTIDADMRLERRPESVVGTYANRMIHGPTSRLIIGPHFVDLSGDVRTAAGLVGHRLAATMTHLSDPEHKVYFLTMEGLFIETDLDSLECRTLRDLTVELELPRDVRPHFKGGYTSAGRVVVANNSYDERDFLEMQRAGRLAEWDGDAWTILDRAPYNEVAGRANMGEVIYATGWDRCSAILRVYAWGSWEAYRLPKASHCFDHCWQTEWPRIREVESERFVMDCHGMFYELSPVAFGGRVWGVRPVSTHLRIIPDFCSWRGLLVAAGNQVTPIGDAYALAGEPQSNLWFGKTDDLWSFGAPRGWGGVWWDSAVSPGVPSDPYLMTGFGRKSMHLSHHADETVRFTVEVDFLGNGTWHTYDRFDVGEARYVHHEFPDGFSAHWVRVIADEACEATAYFHYT